MGKLDDLRGRLGGNVGESMGQGRTPVSTAAAAGIPARLQGVVKARHAAEIPVDKIHRDPGQPREEFDEAALRRLAESLKAKGQLQPIRVRWDEGQGVYLVVCGERRWRAASMAGLATVTAVVMEGDVSPGELLAIQLVENCLREDLRPVEQAKAYRNLITRHGWSIRQLAAELALDHTAVSRALSLLDLPEAVQAQVEQGRIPPWTAYEIVKVDDPAAQTELASRVVAEGLSRAETQEEVRRASGQLAKAKGRGGARVRRLMSRVFRSPASRVTVELRKGEGLGAIAEALELALAAVRAEIGGGDQAAA